MEIMKLLPLDRHQTYNPKNLLRKHAISPEFADGTRATAVSDMFWAQPFDAAAMRQWCWDTWRVVPRPLWAQINWGGRRIETASNIVFSNGRLDPWSSGRILEVRVSIS